VQTFFLQCLLEEKQPEAVCQNSTSLISNQCTPLSKQHMLFPKQHALLLKQCKPEANQHKLFTKPVQTTLFSTVF